MGARNPLVVALAVGCAPHSALDTAQVCVDPVPTAVEPGETLQLRAIGTYGCNATDVVVTCDVVEEEPGELVVTTETTWRRERPISLGCEMMLRWAEGSCETPPLSEGPVALRYGDRELELEIPGDAGGCLDAPAE